MFGGIFNRMDYNRENIVSIRGDGNCMFRSVSYCIYGTQERHREIRLQAVSRVLSEWKRYKDFIIGDPSYGIVRQPGDYQRVMTRDGEFAGHVELHAVSEVYPRYTFRVHRTGSSRTIDYGNGSTVKHLLFSGYVDSGHYSVLEYT